MTSSSPIPLRVSNKKAYVWGVDGETKELSQSGFVLMRAPDIATLRSHHHICGVLTGTLSHLSQQNVFLGVPLLLMSEEVVLLVDKGGPGRPPVYQSCLIVQRRTCDVDRRPECPPQSEHD